MPSRSLLRYLPLAAAAFAVVLLATLVFSGLFGAVGSSGIPFDTDEADHANAALEVTVALERGDVAHLVRSVRRQTFYPPLHSLLVAPFYFALGPTLFSSRLPSVLLFSLVPFLLFTAVLLSAKERGRTTFHSSVLAAALFSAALPLLSPVLLESGALCMLELPGVVLTAALLLVFCCEPLTRPHLLLTSLLLVLMTVTKYNFALGLTPGVLLALLIRPGVPRRKALGEAIFAGTVTLTGLGLWILVSDGESLWFSITGHGKYAPVFSSENLFFYPQAWLAAYHISAPVGCVVTALALIGIVAGRRRPALLLAGVVTLTTWTVTTASAVNEFRHIIITAPGLWLLAGFGLMKILDSLQPLRPWAPSVAVLFLLTGFFAAAPGYIGEIPGLIRKAQEGHESFSALYDFVADEVDMQRPIFAVGFFDQFGQEALRWELARRGGLAYTEVVADSYPPTSARLLRQRNRGRNVDSYAGKPWLAGSGPEEVLAKGGYDYAVVIRGPKKKSRLRAAEFEGLLAGTPQAITRAKGVELTVYQLDDRFAPSPSEE